MIIYFVNYNNKPLFAIMNFQCIRCGYECILKTDMKKHFSRKNTCKPKFKDIELTDSIKEDILENKIYSGSKDKTVRIWTDEYGYEEIKYFHSEIRDILMIGSYLSVI